MAVKPGFKFGVELPMLSIQREKTRASEKTHVVNNHYFGTVNFGYSHYKGFNNSLFFNTELGYRKTRKRGFKTEILLGIGAMRSFLNGVTYTVDDYGSVSKHRMAGSYYFMPSLSYGIGYDFEKKHPELPLSCTLKPTFSLLFPFNNYALPNIAIELGVSYRLSNSFISLKSRKIYKSKNNVL